MASIEVESKEKVQSLTRGTFKTVSYIVLLAALLSVANFFFGWASLKEMPTYLQPYSSILLFTNPYLIYIQAGLFFSFGYLAVKAVSGLVYTYMREISDQATAATLQTIAKIAGIAVLLSMSASILNVSSASALTVGSFGGLVVGFATQTVMSHVIAGVFLLISRPFTYGDVITVMGQTGTVKEIKLMHLVLEKEEGTQELLIPAGNVVTQIVQKKIQGQKPTRSL